MDSISLTTASVAKLSGKVRFGEGARTRPGRLCAAQTQKMSSCLTYCYRLEEMINSANAKLR
jgi:hypothetical protein